MELPKFRYHPDPVRSGSLEESDKECVSCGQARGYIYAGPVYTEADVEDAICPWCIADGSASEKFDATFFDDAELPDEIPEEARDEIIHRTPGFATWQNGKWLACCGDAMAFLEPVGSQEIRDRYRKVEGSLMSYIVYEMHVSGGAANRLLQGLQRDAGPTGYVFQCTNCESQNGFIDGIFSVGE